MIRSVSSVQISSLNVVRIFKNILILNFLNIIESFCDIISISITNEADNEGLGAIVGWHFIMIMEPTSVNPLGVK